MQHAYLLEEGTWEASGMHTNEAGETFAVSGESVITHGNTVWRVTGSLQLSDDPAIHFRNDYEVTPFPMDANATRWVSSNPVIGSLEGQFALVGEAIMSVYRSSDGEHQGSECLRRLEPDRYEGFGALFRRGECISSWSVELKRRE